MKNLLYILLVGIVCSCSEDDSNNPVEITQDTTRELLMLKVDFVTSQFEGAKLYEFEGIEMGSEIPLEEIFIAPDDFGHYTLTYGPTNEIVFDGEVTWMGGSHPTIIPSEFESPTSFSLVENGVEIDMAGVQYFTPTVHEGSVEGHPVNYDDAWQAVYKLQVVHEYLDNGAQVGLVLYTPGLGVFNPEVAKWFVILYK